MADSIREKVLKNLVTATEAITAANGYEVTIRKVFRTQYSPFEAVDFPFVVLADLAETKSDGNPAYFTTCQLRVELMAWMSKAENQAEELTKLIAAIEKGLYVDQTRGGNAIDTDITENETYLADPVIPYGGVRMTVMIHYRHRLGDPYTK